MNFFDDDIEQLYRGWLGKPAHPNSPCGGGGAGGFRQEGPLGVGSNSGFSSLPHPDSPAGRRLTPEEITKALNNKKLGAENQSSHRFIDDRKKTRLDENEKYLKNTNVKAFLSAIAAEGGDYNLKYGGIKGKKTTNETNVQNQGQNTHDTVRAYYEYETFLDRELNQAYTALMKRVSKESRKNLMDSQKRWLSFRDAEFLFIIHNWTVENFGTSSVLSIGASRTKIIRDRIIELLHYLKNY